MPWWMRSKSTGSPKNPLLKKEGRLMACPFCYFRAASSAAAETQPPPGFDGTAAKVGFARDLCNAKPAGGNHPKAPGPGGSFPARSGLRGWVAAQVGFGPAPAATPGQLSRGQMKSMGIFLSKVMVRHSMRCTRPVCFPHTKRIFFGFPLFFFGQMCYYKEK